MTNSRLPYCIDAANEICMQGKEGKEERLGYILPTLFIICLNVLETTPRNCLNSQKDKDNYVAREIPLLDITSTGPEVDPYPRC